MAEDVGEVGNPGWRRKRKKLFQHAKLLVNERVEVRSKEEGFHGSWHSGTVMACESRARRIRYDHVLCDNGSQLLIECIKVPPIIDGIIPESRNLCSYRGLIRPLPPLHDFQKCSLHYGQCVDVYYEEAWWEGVIFDNEDNSEERKIFFPDTDDEMHFRIDNFRLTHDWDEFTEEWKPRGNWLFLDLVKEFEQCWPLLVSVRQIWYDVRGKKGFQKLEQWTSINKGIWKKLLWDVIVDNSHIAIHQFFWELGLVGDLVQGALLPLSEINIEDKLWTETDSVNSIGVFGNDALDSSLLPTNQGNATVPPVAEEINLDGFTSIEEAGRLDFELLTNLDMPCREETPCNPDEFCGLYSSRDSKINSGAVSEEHLSFPLCKELHARWESSFSDMVVESEYCPQAVTDYAEMKDKHFNFEDKVLQLKAKKHLSAIGWSFWYVMTGGMHMGLRYTSPHGRSYNSLQAACKGYMKDGEVNGSNASTPRPRQNMNVREEARCQLTSERFSSTLSDMESGKDCIVELDGISSSRELVEFCKPPVKEIKKLQRQKMNGLLPGRHDWDSEFPMPLLRPSKRARQAVSSFFAYQNTQNVLSWLIDNNVVFPRAKVRYIDRKNNHIMAKGRITRDGIRCSCCYTDFSLSKFEAHACSTYHRPAANIFLEDGRSLLDCQSELKKRYTKQNTIMEPEEVMARHHRYTNDNICTACCDGGDLILCNQCPSSFHTSCLGMKEVPSRVWFCPACCCGICGRSRLDDDTGNNFMDVSVLTCDQCEHQYHVGCLRERGFEIVDKHPNGCLFCSKECKKISLCLHKLLGKSVSVGVDNLMWTLLKYVRHDDSDDHDGSDTESLIENYSKLSVALSVMHECFEPVKESPTGRDLVEDVIFSRWSELNRFNFRGFYTVILERNDELITAATVRVHGEKVAEVPLVGTRFKYRGLGMCRILMNELEKKLMELGVERLVLPVVPTMLNTWTASFGFSKMTSLERVNFLDYTFLDFHGTVMCQKLLRKTPPYTDLRLIIRKVHEVVGGSDNKDLDQEPAEDIAVDDGGSVTAPTSFEVNQPKQNGNGFFNCYKRRRISN